MGCPITVEMEDGQIINVTGNTCKRGEVYARKEVTSPTPHCNFYRQGKRRDCGYGIGKDKRRYSKRQNL